MPVVHPAELWKESGRYAKIGPELVRFKDRGGRDMVLAMTHEEVVADLLRDLVKSYRQLPAIVYHFQTKFRDEPRARGGLIRVREFTMKDSLLARRRRGRAGRLLPGPSRGLLPHLRAAGPADRRRSVPTSGIMGGSLAHEFMVLNEHGEDTLVLCDACDYAANQQIATRRRARARRGGAAPDRGGRDA